MARAYLAGAIVAGALVLAGCADQGSAGEKIVNGCPTPVHYSDATLNKITKALEALPPGNVLHRAMTDYEYERDDLRFCRCTVAEAAPLPKKD
ncbi:MAG TPA: hypothetical protein VM755_17820 [Stellaceae bacterium]|nr:hypothetical protein [Stellaceae bacterium]